MPIVIMERAFARLEDGRPKAYKAGDACEVLQSEIPSMLARGLIRLQHDTTPSETLEDNAQTNKAPARRGRPKGG